MTILDDVINVNITQLRSGIVSVDFGVAIILSKDTPLEHFGEGLVNEYSSLAAVALDFATDSNTYKMATALFSQSLKPAKILIAYTFLDEDDQPVSLTVLYNAVKDVRNDFYAVLSTTRINDDVVELSTLVEADAKIYGVSLAEEGMLTDAASTLKELKVLSHKRTFVFYTHAVANHTDAAIVGEMLTREVGSATWAYKTLSGITPSNLTDVQRHNIEKENGNYYVNFSGQNCTFYGLMVDGGAIEIRVYLDWLAQRIKENQARLLVSLPRLPYNQSGIDTVANALNEVLLEAKDRNILSDYIISTPKSTAISAQDKQDRILNNVTFTGTLTSSIHKVSISGTVTF